MMKKYIMRRSTRSFNIPPGQPPAHLNFSRLACSNSYPQGGQKLRSKAQPNFFLKKKSATVTIFTAMDWALSFD